MSFTSAFIGTAIEDHQCGEQSGEIMRPAEQLAEVERALAR